MKNVWRSGEIFNLRLIAIVFIPATITLPISESNQLSGSFYLYALGHFSGVLAGLAVLFVGRQTGQRFGFSWFLSVAFTCMAGGAKGAISWQLIDSFGLPQPSLASRVVISCLSWLVVIWLSAKLALRFKETSFDREEMNKLIQEARSKNASLQAQLEWLVDIRIRGLDSRLAQDFYQTAIELDKSGSGPKSYTAIASQLRELSNNHVRNVSKATWPKQSIHLRELLKNAFFGNPDPSLVSLTYLATSALNSYRLFGFDPRVLVALIGSSAIWLAMSLSRHNPFAKHFIWLVAGAATLASYIVFELDTGAILENSIAAAIWAQALAYSLSIIETPTLNSAGRWLSGWSTLSQIDKETSWLKVQFESVNMEVAKYLHSVLQTRLMAHAMRLELNPSPESKLLDDLMVLLTRPMSEYDTNSRSISESLDSLAKSWEPLAKVDLEISQIKETGGPLSLPALQIVREAITNSIRHGAATHVTVRIVDRRSGRTIEVIDNGVGPVGKNRGLGFAIFQTLCRKWKIKRTSNGYTRFVAVLT